MTDRFDIDPDDPYEREEVNEEHERRARALCPEALNERDPADFADGRGWWDRPHPVPRRPSETDGSDF